MSFYEKYFIKKELKAYVISLETPELLFTNLRIQNINPILIKGVDGSKLNISEKKKNTVPFFSDLGTNTTIAIGMSHIKAWKKIIESGDPYGMVFEDDVILTDDFYNKTMQHLLKLPKNYDIFYLGCFGCNNDFNFLNILFHMLALGNFNFKKINNSINRPSLALGTHAYVISRSGAKKVLKELEGKLYFHIDFCLHLLALNNKIKVYSPTKRLAYQKSTDTFNQLKTANSHPLLINKFLSNFYVDEKVKLSYITTVPICHIGPCGFNMTVSSILFVLLGFFLGKADYTFSDISIFYLILSIPDLTHENIDIVGVHFIFFLIGFIIGKKSNE